MVKCGLLVAFDEYICSTCGVVTNVLEDVCSECGDGVAARCQMYRVRGFIQPSTSPDTIFRPNYTTLRQLHDQLVASRVNGSNDEKKKALEGYMEYLFGQVEGSSCVAKDSRSSYDEVDLIFRSINNSDELMRLMSPNYLVQCRNTAASVDSGEMRNFKEALSSRSMAWGVYVSINRFTGMKGNGVAAQDCKQVIRDARRDGINILTIDLADLESIFQGRSLVDILWDQRTALLAYGPPVSSRAP